MRGLLGGRRLRVWWRMFEESEEEEVGVYVGGKWVVYDMI